MQVLALVQELELGQELGLELELELVMVQVELVLVLYVLDLELKNRAWRCSWCALEMCH